MSKFKSFFLTIIFVFASALAAHASSFAGTWVGVGTNNFDVSYDEIIIINVSGSDVYGSYESSQQAGTKWEMKGKITGDGTAEATVFGLGNSVLSFRLKGRKLTYTWQWGKGVLEKQ